jgi:hypothetical protein
MQVPQTLTHIPQQHATLAQQGGSRLLRRRRVLTVLQVNTQPPHHKTARTVPQAELI